MRVFVAPARCHGMALEMSVRMIGDGIPAIAAAFGFTNSAHILVSFRIFNFPDLQKYHGIYAR